MRTCRKCTVKTIPRWRRKYGENSTITMKTQIWWKQCRRAVNILVKTNTKAVKPTPIECKTRSGRTAAFWHRLPRCLTHPEGMTSDFEIRHCVRWFASSGTPQSAARTPQSAPPWITHTHAPTSNLLFTDTSSSPLKQALCFTHRVPRVAPVAPVHGQFGRCGSLGSCES